ncbi:MAG: PDZ domain-containing protein [Actinomycetota bacterium]
MKGDAGKDGLRRGLDSMVAVESRLEQRLAEALAETKGYLEAPTIIGRLQSLVVGQREALQTHVQELGDTDVPVVGSAISVAFEAPSKERGKQGDETIATLRALATAFAETAFAYAVLHALAHRSYHVPTANLADEHRRNYLAAAQAIHQAVGDVAVEELQEDGLTCRCECPSCSPGICLCWHVHADPGITGPGAPTEGIVVRAPRAGSHAERADLRHGDVILAVGDKGIHSYQDMLDRMRDHQPGEVVSLRVRRGADEAQEVMITP